MKKVGLLGHKRNKHHFIPLPVEQLFSYERIDVHFVFFFENFIEGSDTCIIVC